MTDDQFSALAKLIQMRASASREAARLVLVDGLSPSAAARQAGCTPQAASNALSRARSGIELAKKIFE